MRLRKIVVATDFSRGSEHALASAVDLARTYDAELLIVHALEVPTAFGGEIPPRSAVIEEVEEDAVNGLEHALREARQKGITRVSTQLLHGPVPGSLLRLLETGDVDLVVVGTHGRTGMARVLIGSIAEKIVRHARCSVLVARA